MAVPKQHRTRTHARDRRTQQALEPKTLTAAGAQPHRISAAHPTYKGRDYSDVFAKKKK